MTRTKEQKNINQCICGGEAVLRMDNECFGHGDYSKKAYVQCSVCHTKIGDVYAREISEEQAAEKAIDLWNIYNPILAKNQKLNKEIGLYSIGYLLVWICSGIAFWAYQEGIEIIGIISTFISVGYFYYLKHIIQKEIPEEEAKESK